LNGKANSSVQNIPVYFASAEIPAGTTFESMVNNSLLTMKTIPTSAIVGIPVQSSGEINSNEVTKSVTAEGQMILKSMFAPATTFSNGLNIPQNSLAISVSVDDVSRVANFVVPGSRVVVFSTGLSGKNYSVTRVLVSSALVLAIGSQVSTPVSGIQVTNSPLVTLAVEPYEAEQILHASQTTKLSFALAYGNEPTSINLPRAGTSTASLFREG
jgi:Flp pilus assembly protein CpaB